MLILVLQLRDFSTDVVPRQRDYKEAENAKAEPEGATPRRAPSQSDMGLRALLLAFLLLTPTYALSMPPGRPVIGAAASAVSKAVTTAGQAVQRAPRLAAASFAVGVGVGVAASGVQNAIKLYLTADDVPGGKLRGGGVIACRVVSVSDGDTMRVRHTPSPFSPRAFKGKLSENTILVRIAAVDAPETAKFGKSGMPLGAEATEFVKAKVLERRVRVRCYSRDQYGRIVGTVEYGVGPWRRDLSTELLKRGLASVYRQAGAVYGKRPLDAWSAIEEEAQARRRGIWSGGVDKAVLPSEFKAKQKNKK